MGVNKSMRKAIMTALKSEDHKPRKELRKLVMLKLKSEGSKEELKAAFIAGMHRLQKKGKVALSKNIVSRAATMAVGAAKAAEAAGLPEWRGKENNLDKGKRRKPDKQDVHDEPKRAKKSEDEEAQGKQKKLYKNVEAEVETRSTKDASTSAPAEARSYPPPAPQKGNVSLLLFYAYCTPQMTKAKQDDAIAHCYSTLNRLGCTGRLRVGREGFNATLTGPSDGIRAFTQSLREYMPETFGHIDFKIVDNEPDNHMLKGLKVWPVTEIVTYGFDPKDAPLELGGTHLKPNEFHEAMADPNSIMIDVRNFNESLIGKFAPPPPKEGVEKVLDPCMRRSTEFPQWVEENRHKLEGKKVLMYCTAGVRCERASAFMRKKGIQNVFQLEGGIHRYLDAYPEEGGFWVGKNYVFDKRFSHGAAKSEVVSNCVACGEPWERYQAQKKCFKCEMEVLVCKTCTRSKPPPSASVLLCPLCKPVAKKKVLIM